MLACLLAYLLQSGLFYSANTHEAHDVERRGLEKKKGEWARKIKTIGTRKKLLAVGEACVGLIYSDLS